MECTDGKAAHQAAGVEPVPATFTAATASGLPASPEKRILMRGKA